MASNSSADPESTVVIRMKSDFDKFLSSSKSKVKSNLLMESVTKHLNFDDSFVKRQHFRESPIFSTASTSAGRPSNIGTPFSLVSESSESPSKKRQREAELITTKTKVSRLGNQLTLLETASREAKIEYDKQIEAIRLDQQSDKEQLADLRNRLTHAIDKEEDMRKEIGSLKRTLKTSVNSYEEKLNALQLEKDDLKSDLEEQVAQLNEAVCMLESDLHRAQMEYNELENNYKACEDQVQQYEKNSVDLLTHTQQMEAVNEELEEAKRKIHELESELDKSADSGTLVKILQGQLTDKLELEKENKRLKHENQLLSTREENIMLLQEKLANSKQLIERLEKQTQSIPMNELVNEDLRHRLGEWENLSIIGCETPKSPQTVVKAVAELQLQNAQLLGNVGQLTSDKKTLEKSNIKLEEEVEKLRSITKTGEITLKQNTDQIRHLQRKLLLVSKERDVCRQMLDSYTKETTVIPSQQESERVKKLEAIVDGYKRTMDGLEKELNAARELLKKIGYQSGTDFEAGQEKLSAEINLLRVKLTNSESQIAQLEEDKKSLELRLEYNILKGEVNPLKTRAIHLSSNPVSWARQQRADELENVKKENITLKERLKILEEVGEPIENLTITVEERLKEAPPAKVLDDLQAQLVAAGKKNNRLMEEFKKISSEFREITYTLLGYNISLPRTGQFKLSNMYADSPDDYLLFAKAETGEVNLLETPYSSMISDKIELYLHTHHSIPAFLSNLTLELFNSQSSIFSNSTIPN